MTKRKLPQIRSTHPTDRLVLATGCFDIIHSGHIDYLNAARDLGDIVVVSLVGDRKARELKGSGRPVSSAPYRAAVIDALKSVDYAYIEPYRPGSERTAFFETIQSLRPDVFIGDDTWRGYESALADQGVEIVFRANEKVDSTTAIIGRIGDMLNQAQVLPHPA